MAGDKYSKLLMIALDAVDPAVVERGIADGSLPALAALRRRGGYTRMSLGASQWLGSPWVSFNAGVGPERHGMYHIFQWRSKRMTIDRLERDEWPHPPWWRTLGNCGPHVLAFDIPYAAPAKPFHGAEIHGWATHDTVFPHFTHPTELTGRLLREFGPRPNRVGGEMANKHYAPQPMQRLLDHADELLDIARQSTAIVTTLMREQPWDLALISFSGGHRAGHLMWDASAVTDADGPEADRQLAAAMARVVRACDEAIAQTIAAAPTDTTVIVFANHGMQASNVRSEILPQMLEAVLAGGRKTDDAAQAARRPSLLRRLRAMIPHERRAAVKQWLPVPVQDTLSRFWFLGRRDWSKTPALAVTSHTHGYIRLNVRGREARGCVEAAEIDAWCDHISEGLLSFVDEDTGQPVVREVRRREELIPEGPGREALPDLFVLWPDAPVRGLRRAVSPRFGAVAWPMPGKSPNGRSGNHRGVGFVLATGPDVTPDSSLGPVDLLDLPATAFTWFGIEPPHEMDGRPIPELCCKSAPDFRT